MDTNPQHYFAIIEVFSDLDRPSVDVLIFDTRSEPLPSSTVHQSDYVVALPLSRAPYYGPDEQRAILSLRDDLPLDDGQLIDGLSYEIHRSYERLSFQDRVRGSVTFSEDVPGWSTTAPVAVDDPNPTGWRGFESNFHFNNQFAEDILEVKVTLRPAELGTGIDAEQARSIALLHRAATGTIVSTDRFEINESIDFFEFSGGSGYELEDVARRMVYDHFHPQPFDADAFLDTLYEVGFGRQADPEGRAFWRDAMGERPLDTAPAVLSAFAASPEMADIVGQLALEEVEPSWWVIVQDADRVYW
ncbi:MAG: hypothetical protein AAGC57_05070 [Pseudomonadota bacterium]